MSDHSWLKGTKYLIAESNSAMNKQPTKPRKSRMAVYYFQYRDWWCYTDTSHSKQVYLAKFGPNSTGFKADNRK